jgi:hypothetical protein
VGLFFLDLGCRTELMAETAMGSQWGEYVTCLVASGVLISQCQQRFMGQRGYQRQGTYVGRGLVLLFDERFRSVWGSPGRLLGGYLAVRAQQPLSGCEETSET